MNTSDNDLARARKIAARQYTAKEDDLGYPYLAEAERLATLVAPFGADFQVLTCCAASCRKARCVLPVSRNTSGRPAVAVSMRLPRAPRRSTRNISCASSTTSAR